MKYRLEEIVDINLFQDLQEKLNLIYSFPSSIIDNDGRILTAVGWQDVCTKFHRINPECERECIKSDQYIIEHLHEANPAVSYKCPHGLIDNAIPIIINGEHLASFFTGQIFLEKPDLEYFRQQAKKYDFDEKEYLEAVMKVPVWSLNRIEKYLDFIKGFIEIIAGIGIKNIKEIETNKALSLSEEKFRKAFMASPDAININRLDDGLFISINEGFSNIMGFTENDVNGKTSLELNIWANLEDRAKLVEELKKDGEVKNLEAPFHAKSGELIYGLMSASIIELNGVKHIISITRDISDRIRAGKELKENQIRNKAILDSLPDIMFINDLNGVYLDYHANDHNLLYVSPEKFLGKTSKEVLPANVAEVFLNAYNKVYETKQMQTVVYSLLLPDNSEKHFEARISPMDNDRLLTMIRDITSMKKAQDALNKYTSDLEIAYNDMKRFNRASEGRELKMIELKREINELLVKMGEPERYKIVGE